MTQFRKPLDDRAALFIAKTALIAHESSIFPEYSSTIAGHLWPSFGRIFDHAPMTTTEKASWPPLFLDAFSVINSFYTNVR